MYTVRNRNYKATEHMILIANRYTILQEPCKTISLETIMFYVSGECHTEQLSITSTQPENWNSIVSVTA